MSLWEALAIAVVAVGSGTLGTMLGLGGGVFLVPILTLAFGVDVKVAAAASAISVVANSASGSTIYLRNRFVNVRLAFVLLVPMVVGALVGGLLAVSLPGNVLKVSLAALMLYVAFVMWRGVLRPAGVTGSEQLQQGGMDLSGHYHDPAARSSVAYTPCRFRVGLPVMGLAGIASGMFGIGGGPITVPLMALAMKVPVKASTSTSSFMFGLTSSVTAFVYYTADKVDPSIAVPAVLGIVGGAKFGAQIATRIRQRALTQVFVVVMALLAVSLLLQAAGVL